MSAITTQQVLDNTANVGVGFLGYFIGKFSDKLWEKIITDKVARNWVKPIVKLVGSTVITSFSTHQSMKFFGVGLGINGFADIINTVSTTIEGLGAVDEVEDDTENYLPSAEEDLEELTEISETPQLPKLDLDDQNLNSTEETEQDDANEDTIETVDYETIEIY